MKKILFVLFAFLVLSGCKKNENSGKLRIVTTIFPLYDFARQIGGDKVSVSMLLPPGTEAHSFEPTPQTIMNINESDCFIYTSEAMEPWVEDIIGSTSKSNVKIVEAGKGFEAEHSDNSSDTDHHEDDGHHHGGGDPHIWLDFEIDTHIVNLIAETLSSIDPANKNFYMNNAAAYNQKLLDLDYKYQSTIARCKEKTILYGGHFAFGHLAKRYGLKHISPYSGFTANTEPTPQKIMELIENIKKNNSDVLFYEELLDPKIAKSIANETGIRLELLHAAHNVSKEELDNNVKFIYIMEENLEKLKKGLRYE